MQGKEIVMIDAGGSAIAGESASDTRPAGPRTMWRSPVFSFRPSRETTCSISLRDGATILVARDRRSRLRGLAGRDRLAPDQALLIDGCRSVHTIGMRFALDLLWLDASGAVIRRDAHVQPRRLRTCLRARSVIETNAGCGERVEMQLAAARRGRP
ncbi:MAG: DUF192 domain-containing protein [Solirubrobacteraceae bacterium]